MPVLSKEDCDAMFLKSKMMYDLPDIMICAGYEEGKRDACDVSYLTHRRVITLSLVTH